MKGSFSTHVMVHRTNGQCCRITREYHELRVAAKKSKKAVPPIPEAWWK